MRQSYTIIVCVLSLFVLPYALWPMVAFVVLFYLWNTKKPADEEKVKTNIVWKDIDSIVKDKQVLSVDFVYPCVKAPQKIRYIHMHPHIAKVIQRLYVLRMYDEQLLCDLTLLLEHFFRIHYNTMIGKYNADTNIQILADVRDGIEEVIQRFAYNVPHTSTIHDIGDIDEYVHACETELLVALDRYIKAVRNKYKKNAFAFTCSRL